MGNQHTVHPFLTSTMQSNPSYSPPNLSSDPPTCLHQTETHQSGSEHEIDAYPDAQHAFPSPLPVTGSMASHPFPGFRVTPTKSYPPTSMPLERAYAISADK